MGRSLTVCSAGGGAGSNVMGHVLAVSQVPGSWMAGVNEPEMVGLNSDKADDLVVIILLPY